MDMKSVAKELLSLDTMVTPKFITFIYWLMLLAVALASIGLIAGGHWIGAILSIPLGALFVRLFCELLIVLFKINDALQEIRKK